MSRIAEKFAEIKERNRVGLVAYLTAGYPDIENTAALVQGMVEGGADLIELGIPFSDPLADGTTVQRASHQALLNGVTVQTCLDLAKQVRDLGVTVPILFMGYYNPVMSYGVDRFCAACEGSGVDGLIIPDLPPEESGDCDRVVEAFGLGMVRLVAPNTPDDRLDRLVAAASGFVYAVTVNGITGSALGDVGGNLDRVAAAAKGRGIPVCAGFGVRTRDDVARLGKHVDGVIVGTALADVIARGEDPIAYLRGLVGAS